MNRKGQAYIFLMFIAALIITGFLISIMMAPMKMVYDSSANLSSVQEDVYQNFYTQSVTIWIWTPGILVVGFILWAVIRAQVRE
jgi:glucan phosphoethanolaminetransferase (alkaline phosphatase superfamily)